MKRETILANASTFEGPVRTAPDRLGRRDLLRLACGSLEN